MKRCFALVAVVALLAGCNGSQATPAATQPPPTQPVATTAAAATFTNPVIDQDFPDPDLLKVGDSYYAYATNSGSNNIQMAKSSDLVHWELLKDALPVLPAWSNPNYTWAPDVSARADGQGYIMYFTARDSKSERQCIGVATAASPEGPFRSPSEQPLICQLSDGGSIDPASFVDQDGKRYVVWKNDGNCCGFDTWLYLQEVSADGLTLQGQPTRLIKQDLAWEGNLVEAPTLLQHGGKYYLLYSANSYAGDRYAVGYAVADQLLGPYRKAEQPLVKTSTDRGIVVGPGGQDIVTDKDGELWLAYHAWDTSVSYRSLNLDPLTWQGDRPVLDGPNRNPEPLP